MSRYNLYYTVEKEVVNYDANDGAEETTGNKTVSVYEIEENTPKLFCQIDTQNEYNSESEIQKWLDDNGYEDEEFNFMQL